MPQPLDDLPLDVLLALQEAAANPAEEGKERARLRAEDAGFWLQCGTPGAEDPAPSSAATEAPPTPEEPEPMAPAPPGTRGVVLDLSAGLSPVLSARRDGRGKTS